MKLQPEEVVEAIARLDHESKQEFAHIFVTKWTTLAGDSGYCPESCGINHGNSEIIIKFLQLTLGDVFFFAVQYYGILLSRNRIVIL